jgi:hypothetical protein
LVKFAWADFLYSPNYQIEAPNLNIGASNFTSPTSGTKISSTLGQTAAEEFASAGYFVRAGFQYIYSIAPFTFSLSNTNINFDTLTPGKPSTATTDLTVSFSSANGYQVTALEDDSLKTLAGAVINDTTCDSGKSCTISSANSWSSDSTYGFGYNMASVIYGNDIPADFTNATDYRPFANASLSQEPVVVMAADPISTPAHLHANSNRQSTMTFKVNIPVSQTAGTYTTVIRFTATPLY